MGEKKNTPLTCPRCKLTRFVFRNHWKAVAAGYRTARCWDCAKMVRRENAALALAARHAATLLLRPTPAPRPSPVAANPTVCRHCAKSSVNRPRGLCWGCYYTPGVRDLYPSTSKYARHGVGNFAGAAPLPPAPTTAPPGTPEKVAVLESRAKGRFALFHPYDARHEGDPRPLDFLRTAGAA
jgi:hypothetical protein